MKKFVFSLAALAKHKASLEKKQKAELFSVLARLNALYEERQRLLRAMEDNAASQQQALAQQRELARELPRHDNYQTFLRQELENTRQQIGLAEAEKKRIQALLIVTVKEVKTLERLREEEYQAYLAQVRKEEDLVIGDIIAYHSGSTDAE
jgi:Fe-S cluster assembly scaffold protein SufB